MEVGANSILYYASRLMQFPLGVFGIALATAVFPTLSSKAARGDTEGFAASLARGLRMVLFIGLPAGVGLMVLRRPVIQLIFERGEFTEATTNRTARALLAYSTAIWAYCAVHVLTRAFYSIKKQGVAARVAGCMVGLNLCLNLALVWPLGEAGLASATAVCAAVQAVLLYWCLVKRIDGRTISGLGKSTIRTLCATAAMAATCWLTLNILPAAPAGLALKAERVLVPMASGGAVYAAMAWLLRSEELSALVDALRRRSSQS
jgi:putative peptidoglycan lipid II flippase